MASSEIAVIAEGLTKRYGRTTVLKGVDLQDAASRPVGKYSGGMRRRLDLAASLILAPPVLFLDEPTTGLDPRSRTEVWTAVRTLVTAGTTVLLTTQHLEEADQLADHITVIDSGRVIADGSPEELKAGLGDDRIEVVVRRAADLGVAADLVTTITGTATSVNQDTRALSAPVHDRVRALTQTVRALHDASIDVEDITLRREEPTRR